MSVSYVAVYTTSGSGGGGGGGGGGGAGAVNMFTNDALGSASVQIKGTKTITPITANSNANERPTVQLLWVLPTPSTNVCSNIELFSPLLHCHIPS